MLFHTGYSLVNSSNTEVQFWGNALGFNISKPENIYLPNGDIVIAPTLNERWSEEYRLVERWIEYNPVTELDVKVGETVEFRDDKIVVVYDYDLPDIDLFKNHIKSKVATKRWEQEVNGLTINNTSYATDRESQTKYTAIAVAISQADANTWSINWKTNSGTFEVLNAQDMMLIINTILQYIQNCFNKEYEYQQQIDSCTTIEQVMAIDYNSNWP